MFKKFFLNKKLKTALVAIEKEPENIIKLTILADIYYENKFYSEAINTLEKILRIDENYLPALDKLGNIYLKTKQFLKAYRTLKLLFKLNPNNITKTKLFSLKDATCDIEAKVEILKGLLEFDDNIEMKELLASAYLISGQYFKSVELYEILFELEEKNEYLIKLIELYYKLERWTKASQNLEKLMLTGHFSTQHSEILADVYKKEKRLDEAIGVYQILIESNPQKAEFYKSQIAKIHLLKQEPDKTILATNELLQKNEFDFDAKFLTVQAFLDKKEYKEAIEFLKEFYFDPISPAIESQIIEKIVSTSVLYSKQLREQKNYTEAVDVLTVALRYNENSKEIYIELAEISEDIKDFSSATEYRKIAEFL